MRIVSLLPAATEIVYALGLDDELVGRTEACDHPADAADVPVVGGSMALDAGEASGDLLLAHASHGGALPGGIDAALVASLQPDLILHQRLCDLCAATEAQVAEVVRALGGEPTVVRLEPRSVEGVFNAISTVGAFAEAEDEAIGLLEILRERLGALENRVLERRLMGLAPRRVVVLSAIAPLVASGQWVPEMVRRAGGWDLLGRDGASPPRTSWEAVREVDPEQIVLALAASDADEAGLAWGSADLPAWLDDLRAVREGESFAVDGRSLFARPGPRILDGIGLLAGLFDPEGAADLGPPDAWVPLSPAGQRSGHIG